MRSTRLSLAVLTVAACLGAAPLAAQGSANWDVRPNSWYWGLYGGQTSFPTSIARTYAPVVGGEWTITRSRFALNVFAEQSYFNAVSTITDFPTSAPRRVDIKDLRRVGAAAFSFLPPYKYFHPYFGVGYAFNMIREATPQGSSFASAATRDTINARVESARAAGKIFGELGMMVSWKQWAPFVSYDIMPTKGNGNWFVNGEGFTNVLKVGFRYAFGPAVEEHW